MRALRPVVAHRSSVCHPLHLVRERAFGIETSSATCPPCAQPSVSSLVSRSRGQSALWWVDATGSWSEIFLAGEVVHLTAPCNHDSELCRANTKGV
jgi:hypothetical protein